MRADLDASRGHHARMQDIVLHDPLVSLVALVPPVGHQRDAAAALLGATGALLDAGDRILLVGDRFVGIKESEPGSGSGSTMTRLVGIDRRLQGRRDRGARCRQIVAGVARGGAGRRRRTDRRRSDRAQDLWAARRSCCARRRRHPRDGDGTRPGRSSPGAHRHLRHRRLGSEHEFDTERSTASVASSNRAAGPSWRSTMAARTSLVDLASRRAVAEWAATTSMASPDVRLAS